MPDRRSPTFRPRHQLTRTFSGASCAPRTSGHGAAQVARSDSARALSLAVALDESEMGRPQVDPLTRQPQLALIGQMRPLPAARGRLSPRTKSDTDELNSPPRAGGRSRIHGRATLRSVRDLAKARARRARTRRSLLAHLNPERRIERFSANRRSHRESGDAVSGSPLPSSARALAPKGSG